MTKHFDADGLLAALLYFNEESTLCRRDSPKAVTLSMLHKLSNDFEAYYEAHGNYPKADVLPVTFTSYIGLLKRFIAAGAPDWNDDDIYDSVYVFSETRYSEMAAKAPGLVPEAIRFAESLTASKCCAEPERSVEARHAVLSSICRNLKEYGTDPTGTIGAFIEKREIAVLEKAMANISKATTSGADDFPVLDLATARSIFWHFPELLTQDHVNRFKDIMHPQNPCDGYKEYIARMANIVATQRSELADPEMMTFSDRSIGARNLCSMVVSKHDHGYQMG